MNHTIQEIKKAVNDLRTKLKQYPTYAVKRNNSLVSEAQSVVQLVESVQHLDTFMPKYIRYVREDIENLENFKKPRKKSEEYQEYKNIIVRFVSNLHDVVSGLDRIPSASDTDQTTT